VSPRVIDELREILGEAVKRQLVADVPVGVFLSGGVDSSSVAALASPSINGPLRTFSVGFDGPDARSELPAARLVARSLGSEHHELRMDPGVVAADLDRILDDLDTPLADPTAIPTWYMSKLARETVTVALSGEGADEVFGGYERQRYDALFDRFGALGRRLVPWMLRMAGRRPSDRLIERAAMAPGLDRQLHWGRIFTSGGIDELTVTPLADEPSMLAPYGELAERWRRFDRCDPVNGRLTTDREIFLPGDLLPKVDRMSMAHSLEVRVPFLDNEVVDYVLPLPGRLKATARKDKIVLRRAMSGVIPMTTATRRKQAFEVPIGAWIRGRLRDTVGDLLAGQSLRSRGIFEPSVVERLLDDHLAGRADHGQRLWTLAVLEHWLRGVDASASEAAS
jgi:asparagine synthase (glutamine-hydrolysing)